MAVCCNSVGRDHRCWALTCLYKLIDYECLRLHEISRCDGLCEPDASTLLEIENCARRSVRDSWYVNTRSGTQHWFRVHSKWLDPEIMQSFVICLRSLLQHQIRSVDTTRRKQTVCTVHVPVAIPLQWLEANSTAGGGNSFISAVYNEELLIYVNWSCFHSVVT